MTGDSGGGCRDGGGNDYEALSGVAAAVVGMTTRLHQGCRGSGRAMVELGVGGVASATASRWWRETWS